MAPSMRLPISSFGILPPDVVVILLDSHPADLSIVFLWFEEQALLAW